MQAAFNLDQWADLSTAPEQMKLGVKWKQEKGRAGLSPYYPAGMVVEGLPAVALCRTGQCRPIDNECREALGMTEEQLQKLNVEYQMAALGIHSQNDKDLYLAEVIEGYQDVDGKTEYKPGPKWDEYQAALKSVEAEDDEG